MAEPETDRCGCRLTESRAHLNIELNSTVVVRGPCSVTDLNQHLLFIKLSGGDRRGALRGAGSHLQIDLNKL